MSLNRSLITDILLEAFNDPEIKQRCLQAKKKLLRGDTRVRIFDDFPCLLPQNDIAALTTRLLKFLSESRSIRKTSSGIQVASLSDVLIIRQLQKDIARIGCVDLLDEKGEIKKEIMKLLEWEGHLNREQTGEVLRAYVGSVNQVMMEHSSAMLEKNSTTLMGLCDCINKNYGKWTDQVFNEFFNPDMRFYSQKNRLMILTGPAKPRVFDEATCLLSNDDLAILFDRFRKILCEIADIKQVGETYDGFEFVNAYDKQIVKRLGKDIAAISCAELLDENGQIRKEIVKLLEWEEHLNQENICEIIFDHVYAINQTIMTNFGTVNDNNRAAHDELCAEINLNYIAWTIEILKANGIIQDTRRLERIGIGIGVGIGMGALALASLAGILLFKDYPSLSSASTLDKEPKLHK